MNSHLEGVIKFMLDNKRAANAIESKETEYYLKDFLPIPKNVVTILTSAGGVGKTMLAIQLAIRLVAEAKNRKVLLWLTEDGIGQTKKRIDEILAKILTTVDVKVLENIDVIGAEGGSKLVTEEDKDDLQEAFIGYDLVVIDPLIAFYGYESENNNKEARQFMQMFNQIAIENNQSILFLHHNNKGENATARGASDFINACRLLYKIEYIENSNKRKITVEKENGTAKMHLGSTAVERVVMPFEFIKIDNKMEDKNGRNKH